MCLTESVNKKLEGKSLRQSDIRKKTGCSVIAITNGEKLDINPDPDRVMEKGEVLILMGQFEGESRYNEIYENE